MSLLRLASLVLVLGCALLSSALCAADAQAADAKRPNVIFILADDKGYLTNQSESFSVFSGFTGSCIA